MKTRTTSVNILEVENGYLVTRTQNEYDVKGNIRGQSAANFVARNTAELFTILNDCYAVQAN